MVVGNSKFVEDCSFEELLGHLHRKYLTAATETERSHQESGRVTICDAADQQSGRVTTCDAADQLCTTSLNNFELGDTDGRFSILSQDPATESKSYDETGTISTFRETTLTTSNTQTEDGDSSSDGEDNLFTYLSNLTAVANNPDSNHRDHKAKKKTCYALSPSSRWAITHKVMALVVIAYDLWSIPLVYTFDSGKLSMNRFMLIFWTLHLMMSPFVGYIQQDGQIEVRLKKTMKKYVKHWMIFDMALVLRELIQIIIGNTMLGDFDRFIAFRLARLLKTRRMINTPKLFIQSGEMKSLLRCAELSLFFLFVCHYFACGWYLLGVHYKRSKVTWISIPMSDVDTRRVIDRSANSRYMFCFYWTLNQIGFGRSVIQPTNSAELMYSVFVCINIVISFVTMVAGIMTVLAKFIYERQVVWESELHLRRYLRHHDIAPAMKARIGNVTRQMRGEKPSYVAEESVALIQNLPEALSQELRMAVFLGTAMVHPFFQACVLSTAWKKPVKELVGIGGVNEMRVDRDGRLFEPERVCESMFFVVDGALQYRIKRSNSTLAAPDTRKSEVLLPVRAVALITPRMWICETALWTEWHHRGVCTNSRSSVAHLVLINAEVFGLTICKHIRKSPAYGKRFMQLARSQGFASDIIEDEGGQLQSIAESVFLVTEFHVTSCRPARQTLYSWRTEWSPWSKKQWDVVWRSCMEHMHLDNRGALLDAMTKDFKHDIVLMYQTLFSDNMNSILAPAMKDEEHNEHNTKLLILKRLFLCFAVCGLRMATETNSSKTKPWPFPLASAMCHGQRVVVSLYGISAQEFLNVLTFGTPEGWDWDHDGVPTPFYTRWFATHALQLDKNKKKQPSPFVDELKLKTIKNIDQSFSSKHLGVDLPVGGLGNPVPTTDVNKKGLLFVGPAGVPYQNPRGRTLPYPKPAYLKDIQHGHLFVHWDNWVEDVDGVASCSPVEDGGRFELTPANSFRSSKTELPYLGKEGTVGCVMIGIEGSAPSKKDFLGGAHGLDGVPHVQSAFGKCKWNRYNATQHGVPADYGGMRVNVDRRRLRQLLEVLETSQFCRCDTMDLRTSAGRVSVSGFQNMFSKKKTHSQILKLAFDNEADFFKALLQASDSEAEMLMKAHYDVQRVPLKKRDEVLEHVPVDNSKVAL